MRFQYPSQRLQDWLSQLWVMARGRKIDPAQTAWLIGPFGDVDVIADHYIQRLARDESLTIERFSPGGLLESAQDLLGSDAPRLDPRIRAFYEHTARHELEVWSQWSPLFRPFAALVQILYSRRLQQLNLPLDPLDTSRGITSEVVKLRDRSGAVRYSIWLRHLKTTGRVIYSGIYMTTSIPDGRRCAKIVFPLPRGNATVIMAPSVDDDGGLDLVSRGERFGHPGFYFLLRDSRSRHWAQYIRSFRERITVYVDGDGSLRADHALSLWGLTALRLHYKIAAAPTVQSSLIPAAHPASS